MSKEYYESKNQNIVPTEMLFEMFNKIPNRKEGNSEMGMDEYEQKNLATILKKLNKAEAENQKLRNEIASMNGQHSDTQILKKLSGMILDDCSEIHVSFKMKDYYK